MGAEEALKFSLINDVEPKREGMQATEELANNLGKKSLQDLSRIKK